MIPEKKKRVVATFAVIYLIFGIALTYLLLFNSGIMVNEKPNPSTGRTSLIVSNESSHLIYNISVSYLQESGAKKEISNIFKLAPGETETVSLIEIPSSMEEAEVHIEAPFHVLVTKKVALETARTVNLQIKVSAPRTTYVGSPTNLNLEICNHGDPVRDISVDATYAEEFFTNAIAQKTIGTLTFKECESLLYVFNPKKAGTTKIYFNINAYDTTQEIEKELTIQEVNVPLG